MGADGVAPLDGDADVRVTARHAPQHAIGSVPMKLVLVILAAGLGLCLWLLFTPGR